MTYWRRRKKDDRFALEFCVSCQQERAFADRRCTGCNTFVPKESKMGNHPTKCAAGVRHMSKLEAQHCDMLHALQEAGEIRELEAHPQPRVRLEANGHHITTYVPDFKYVDCKSGETVYADAKGYRTEVYKIKAALMLALLGIEVEELGRIR